MKKIKIIIRLELFYTINKDPYNDSFLNRKIHEEDYTDILIKENILI